MGIFDFFKKNSIENSIMNPGIGEKMVVFKDLGMS